MTDSGTTSSTTSSSQALPTATFVPLLDVAHVQEAVNMQVKAMDQSSGQVNAVSGRPHSKGKGKGTLQGKNRGNNPGKPSGGSQETKRIRHVTRIVLPEARNVMHAARLDILQSVAKQRNASLLQDLTREGIIHGVEPINYQRIQPLTNKIILHLQLESVSLQVVVKLI